MTKIVLKVVLALAVLITGFNYFFGNDEEKENSRRIVGQVKELSGSVFDLLKSEKERFDEGKYHDALAKLKEALRLEHDRAESLGDEAGHDCLEKCEHLEQKEQDLEKRLDAIVSDAGLSGAERDKAVHRIRKEILQLTDEARNLAVELDG